MKRAKRTSKRSQGMIDLGSSPEMVELADSIPGPRFTRQGVRVDSGGKKQEEEEDQVQETNLSADIPDRSPEEEDFSKWLHTHPHHESDHEWGMMQRIAGFEDQHKPDPAGDEQDHYRHDMADDEEDQDDQQEERKPTDQESEEDDQGQEEEDQHQAIPQPHPLDLMNHKEQHPVVYSDKHMNDKDTEEDDDLSYLDDIKY